ncbi:MULTISPECIES: hypothetical protein [unclassified Leeuwenhoekiella]|uniref:hypothetical protein n=1 Tax=unclassified Leeuwenhoekiella TaxID=2615029 RepID=UPI000C527F73|nr:MULTISPECIES: hypothetical protein [unclassified Leeuwenhoekiella]MAW97139.1 hypothetical protein [Leeuwenhoekiella sp.]MBA82655.1 hypothetical protein [Leeuwenhoekiella sp.]|tara:strand:+ start:34346 stop:34873 length:528 start_codon:yes stop_codon:yes gene_type:complete
MRKFTLFLLLLISLSKISAQSENNKDYLTREDNVAWLESFKNLETEELQLQAIREKIYSDSLYIAPRPGISYTGLSSESRKRLKARQDSLPKVTSDCKILMILNSEQNQTEINLEKNPKSIEWVEKLIPQNIESIQILEGTEATALYGSRTRGCAVLLLKASIGKLSIPSTETNH